MTEDFFVVQGLGGKRALAGELPVRGSKNAALPALAERLGVKPVPQNETRGVLVVMLDGRQYDQFELLNAVLDKIDV